MNAIINPHDKLFREIWSDKSLTIDFIQHYLPAEILRLIDPNTLEISKESFIEEELKAYYADLLYSVNLSGFPGYVYLLFEHKSYADKLTPLQVLEYMTKIWRLHLKQKKIEKLPAIIPMVIYHGAGKWHCGDQLERLIAQQESQLKQFIPNFRFVLYDLSQYSDEQIKGNILNRVMMLLFKHVFDPNSAKVLPAIFALLKESVETESGLRYLEAFLRYIFSTVDDISPEEIRQLVEQAIPHQGGFVMSLAERLREEGYQKGVEIGLEKGLEKGMEKGLEKGILEGIELGVDLRFGNQSRQLMHLIRKIQDVKKLKIIKDAIKKTQDISELQLIINRLAATDSAAKILD